MGLLDSLLSTAVERATGVNAKRIIRKVGAGKILMAGGAALAGGLAMERMNRKAPGTSAGGSALPPIPATPASADLPPLPDLGADDGAEAGLSPGANFAVIRTMIGAAWSDGELDAEERKMIRELMDDGSLSAEEIEQVNKDLMIPASPEELAGGVSTPEEAEALYRAAILVVRADGIEAGVEHVWLERLADSLGLGAEARGAIVGDLDAVLDLPPLPPAE